MDNYSDSEGLRERRSSRDFRQVDLMVLRRASKQCSVKFCSQFWSSR
jgi:hypothetical protein